VQFIYLDKEANLKKKKENDHSLRRAKLDEKVKKGSDFDFNFFYSLNGNEIVSKCIGQ